MVVLVVVHKNNNNKNIIQSGAVPRSLEAVQSTATSRLCILCSEQLHQPPLANYLLGGQRGHFVMAAVRRSEMMTCWSWPGHTNAKVSRESNWCRVF